MQPDEAYLELLGDLLRREVDVFEVAPETTWRVDEEDTLRPNGFHHTFRALGRETGNGFVAHGVGMSMASSPWQRRRRDRWLAQLARDQRQFRYRWYTDHAGVTSLAGCAITLPVSLPMTEVTKRRTQASLRAMQTIVADVGLETTAQYFWLGSPMEEPEFLRAVLRVPRSHLLLDLHNVIVMANNAGFDPLEYVAELPLDRVIEIHLAGGRRSQPGWLPSGATRWLDSHDTAVSDEVWRLFELVLPACPNVRAVIIERMEGTVAGDEVESIRSEVRRARRMTERRTLGELPLGRGSRSPSRADRRPPPASATAHRAFERVLLDILIHPDPPAAAARAARSRSLPSELRRTLRLADPEGLRLAALLIARLRFERLLSGSTLAGDWFDDDARAFSAAFRRYHHSTPPTAFFPPGEADLFERWLASSGAGPRWHPPGRRRLGRAPGREP